jgi:restriction system protein
VTLRIGEARRRRWATTSASGTLAQELLDRVKTGTPEFFEIVVEAALKMGYGGSRADAGSVGQTGDGRIDGIIKDRLRLDVIYLQAKRWQATVGR